MLRKNNKVDIAGYMKDRVEKLRELYSENTPKIKKSRAGVGNDKRRYPVIETVIGKDYTPFETENFEETMPQVEKYSDIITPIIIEEKAIEISKIGAGLRLDVLKKLKQENPQLYHDVEDFNAKRDIYGKFNLDQV
jgi:bisphosphoglycerate-dependent phosphoglycerate mutase